MLQTMPLGCHCCVHVQGLSLLTANSCCNGVVLEYCTLDELNVTASIGNVNTMPRNLGWILTSVAIAAAETSGAGC